MKKITLFIFTLMLTQAKAEMPYIFGLEGKLNFANQIAKDPLNVEQGKANWKSLTCFGMNYYMEYKKSKHFRIVGKFGYIQKGFVQPEETTFLLKNGAANEPIFTDKIARKNKFHYLHIDLLGKYNFGRKAVIPFIFGGLRGDYLIGKDLQSETTFALKGNKYSDYSFYKGATVGLVAGLGVCINHLINISVETNYDVTRSVQTSHLFVKNWLYTINMGFNLNEIIYSN